MDKKFFLKMVTIVFLIFATVVLVATLIRNTINDEWEYINMDLLAVFVIGVPIPLLLTVFYIIMYISDKVINSGRKVINFDKSYINICTKYNY